ncbi:hypothetical protein EZV62_019763 [Acer yangbiense]|uniref:Beta-galactosidase beta-sandwich domain-containing protein n=1 Tax=Acer yangbiense TaxID=1000413 RepID=A0A5C7HC44_9ROSI|nr:hypothetical protein EZV62_019763 [Acer yangbiense]
METTKLILYALSLCFLFQALTAFEVSHDGRAVTIDGQRRMWPCLLRKSKEGGLNAIETYVFWNAYEPSRRQYDFNGNLDLATIYATEEGSGCFLSNANMTTNATITFQGSEYVVPGWSVSILPDCKNEEYNTAKVNAQTSLMVKKSNEAEEEPASLKWVWRPEIIDGPVLEERENSLLVSLLTRNKSMMKVAIFVVMFFMHMSMENILIQNGPLKTSEIETGTKPVSSAHCNYGPMFDLVQSRIPGPVELVGRKGDERVVKDLLAHKWSYKVGFLGLDDKLSNSDSDNLTNWLLEELPSNRRMTWYKTTFEAPLGFLCFQYNDEEINNLFYLNRNVLARSHVQFRLPKKSLVNEL